MMDTVTSANPPAARDDVDRLVAHIKRLREEGLHIRPRRDAYGHMGATITDTALQAGWDYRRFVEPRVKDVLTALDGKPRTSDFLDLLEEQGPEAALDVRGRKPLVARRLARLLKTESVEAEEELRDWIVKDGSREKLIALKGVKKKTADYLAIRTGVEEAVAIDIHVRRCLSDAGIEHKGYDESAAIVRAAAHELEVTPASLEGAIWRYQRRKRREQR